MKTIKTIISNVGLISFVSLVCFVSLVSSCSKDDGFDEEQSVNAAAGMEIGGVSGYSTYFEEKDTRAATRSGDALTRAWERPTGYEEYGGGVQPISFALTYDGITDEAKEKLMGTFFYSSEKWRTDLEELTAGNYYLYGYIPHMTAIKFGIKDAYGEDDNYSKGAIMTLRDVPTVMPNDLCVVIGAKHGYDKEHDGNSDGTNRLRQGDFGYTAAAISGVPPAGKNNFVFLLFDHLYAALQVTMSVDADYNKLRTIKLKSLKLSTKAGETTTKLRNNITIHLIKTDGSSSPITNINYVQTGDDISDDGLQFWPSKNDKATVLGTVPQEFTGHFLPQDVTTLILTSTYDVYDKNVTTEHPEGNLIRKDCKATNIMALGNLYTEDFDVTKRGVKYIVNMTINPTYLYMLSEPDLDNPTVVVN